MTEESAPAAADSPHRPKYQTPLTVGAALLILVTLLYLSRMPGWLHWPMRLLFVAALAWVGYSLIRKVRATQFEAKKIVFSLIIVGFLYGLLFLICHVFVKLMSVRDEQLGVDEQAAWAVMGRILLNLSEFITKP